MDERLSKSWESDRIGGVGILDLINQWESNCFYPDGIVSYRIKINNGKVFEGRFEAKTPFLVRAADCLAKVAFGCACAALLIGATVSLQLEAVPPILITYVAVSGELFGAAATAGTVASCFLSYTYRHTNPNPEFIDDVIDVFTCATAILGSSVWREGSKLKLLASIEGTPKLVSWGYFGSSVGQGIFVSEKTLSEIQKIKGDERLSKESKFKKLSSLLQNAAMTGLVLAVDLRNSTGEIRKILSPGADVNLDDLLKRKSSTSNEVNEARAKLARRTQHALEVDAGALIESGSILKLEVPVSSGVVLESTPGRTTTILGNYKLDMKNVVAHFPKSEDFGPKPNGFNVLNVPDEVANGSKDFWKGYNEPFLQKAVDRNDRILMATNPELRRDLLTYIDRKTGKEMLTGFGKEYKFLTERGYRYENGEMIR